MIRAPKIPNVILPDADKRRAIHEWIELRAKIGSAAAGREVGHPDTRLRYWAQQLGIAIPTMKHGKKN